MHSYRNFPQKFSFFLCCFIFCQDMEQVINIEWPELSIKKLRVILSAQIQRLLASFDIYLETQSPIEFPQQKIYFKGIQGRNRCRPYKFISGGGGIFTQ